MCLDLKSRFSRKCVAKTDIVCYKFVYQRNDGTYTTPYMFEKVILGGDYLSEITKEDKMIEKAFHSFANAENCISRANIDDNNTVVVKCIIPAGSEYYKGTFSTYTNNWFSSQKFPSYASNRIKYLEVIHVVK